MESSNDSVGVGDVVLADAPDPIDPSLADIKSATNLTPSDGFGRPKGGVTGSGNATSEL